jgi:hypothetical protein
MGEIFKHFFAPPVAASYRRWSERETVMLLRLLLGAALLCSAATAMSANQLPSRSAWEAAVGGTITTDPFATDIAGQASITFDSGVSRRPPVRSSHLQQVVGGAYLGAVDDDGSVGYDQILWDLPTAHIRVRGGLVLERGRTRVSSGSPAISTAVARSSSGQLTRSAAGGTGFFGIVGSATFSSVRLFLSGSNNNESFQRGQPLVPCSASVPEPASLALI